MPDLVAGSSKMPDKVESSVEEFNFHKNNRKHVRQKVTKKCEKLRTTHESLTGSDRSAEISHLRTLDQQLDKLNDKINSGLWRFIKDRDEINGELDRIDEYSKTISDTIALLETVPNEAQPTRNSYVPTSQMKLPQLPLPEYGHELGQNIARFISDFEAVTGKYNLSQFDKFVLLKGQLKNEPLTLIGSLQGENQTYTEARTLLEKAFGSKTLQKFDVIETLSKLNLSSEEDPFLFISSMNNIIYTFNSLTMNSDDVLQYFIWRALPHDLQSQFILLSNKSYPDLADIRNHIYEAVNRYKASVRNYKYPNTVGGFAAGVEVGRTQNYSDNESKRVGNSRNFKFKPCVLCSTDKNEAEHSTSKCPRYPDHRDKIERIKTLSLCFRCLSPDHGSSNCTFKFKKCFNCGKTNHLSFLCYKLDNKSFSSDQGARKVNYYDKKSEVYVGCETNTPHSNVILPTFTCSTNGGGTLRVLLDTGAQSCFIDSDFAKKQNLKVLNDNVKINVNGFNTNVSYSTRIVECDVRFGDTFNKIQAICVPEIKTKCKIPGLKIIADSFVKKGYKLADSSLTNGSEEIKNLNFILGSNALHTFSFANVNFGKNAFYFDSIVGVILAGRTDLLNANLNCLPISKHVSCSNVSIQANHSHKGEHLHKEVIPLNTEQKELHVTEPCTSSGITGVYFGDEVEVQVFSAATEVSEITFENAKDAAKSMIADCSSDILNEKCYKYLNYIDAETEMENDELNRELTNFAIDNHSRDNEGRIIMPILWNESTSDLMNSNYNLAQNILKSNLSKLKKNPSRLAMVDKVFKDQIDAGVIVEIENFKELLHGNDIKFLSHMPVFKMNNDTTKCRVVYLANLAQKPLKGEPISHNKAIYPGPNLNKKITTALVNLRFDAKLLVFDIVKAFLQLGLKPDDQLKLCLLWYKDVNADNFEIVAYKCSRVPFGLPCSPALLMIALYIMLIVDGENDPQDLRDLKTSIYHRMYMDNGAVGAPNSDQLLWAFRQIRDIFGSYSFPLQKFVSNDKKVNELIKLECNESPDVVTKLLGLNWNVESDNLFADKCYLDVECDTKRKVLSTYATNYDVFNINGPVLNRARLFLHLLQCKKDLKWDQKLSVEELNEWRNICNQVNKAQPFEIERFVGNETDSYQLIVCTDSSKDLCGVVLYLLNNESGKMNFLAAKNKIVGKNLENRSIPCLELVAILMGVETAIDMYKELSSNKTVNPIKITKLKLFTDSHVCLNWIQNFHSKYSKTNKLSVFVKNKLRKIGDECKSHEIEFRFCSGVDNPADFMTRVVSSKQLLDTNFHSGLNVDFVDSHDDQHPTVIVPNPNSVHCEVVYNITSELIATDKMEHEIVDSDRISNFGKLVNVHYLCLKFINQLKLRLKAKNGEAYQTLNIRNETELRKEAHRKCIAVDQWRHFPEVFNYLLSNRKLLRDAPPIISQLNVFLDQEGILRVKAKFKNWRGNKFGFPILLSKHSDLARKIVFDIHTKIGHSGVYSVLTELRKTIWIPQVYSFVKIVLRNCIVCRKQNNKPFKINQNSYRSFRSDPSVIPFRNIFIDYCGPYYVHINGSKTKVYLLIISCLWCRAVNIKISLDLSVQCFLRSLQLHVYEYGIPELIISDMGSQLRAGANIVAQFLSDKDSVEYLMENSIKKMTFEQFPKGRKELGGLIEIMVKLVKRLLSSSVGHMVLDYFQFEFFVAQACHLVNRRPVAYKEALRDSRNLDFIPEPITPELLVKGYNLVSLNIIPELQRDSRDPDWSPFDANPDLAEDYNNLRRTREKLQKLYHEEFLATLAYQSSNMKKRFEPVKYTNVECGDLVLIREPFLKQSSYPLAIVESVLVNDMGEVTSAQLLKGATREKLERHVSSLIPLLRKCEYKTDNTMNGASSDYTEANSLPKPRKPSQRKAAINCRQRIKRCQDDGAV